MPDLYAIAQEITKKREDNLKNYACKSSSAKRLIEEPIERVIDIRPPFFRDADRIIHSNAYARYMDKTQVFPMVNNDNITHRGLHVQFVAKIARTIGRILGLNEDLIEAIGLGHDLGHVPFGHFGERVLSKICEENGLGLFLHNAQSVRVLQTLEQNGVGLNMTVQVLDGILCHNGEMIMKKYEPDYDKTIDQFFDEYEKCWTIKGYDKKIRAMTLEGCVVRISDVIAYIGRDIEDAITLGVIKREDIPQSVVEVLGNTNSQIIDTLVNDLIEQSLDKPYLEFSDDVFNALKTLMDFNYENIYHSASKAEVEESSVKMFNQLFKVYTEDIEQSKGYIYDHYMSNMKQGYANVNSCGKIAVDFIAGMTDNFFMEQYENSLK